VLLAALLLGLRLLLPLFAAPPALLAAAPADGDAGVTPRTRLTLRFNGPMNPRSVERAVLLRPATAWLPIWSDDRVTLTISPTAPLLPDTGYSLTLDTQALSQRFRALERPIELRFRTAPAPAVVRVLPENGTVDVPLDAPISIRFSRVIVPADAVDTFDTPVSVARELGIKAHDADLHHVLFLHHMASNGVEVVKELM